MSKYSWKELALADAKVTAELLDGCGVMSHKVLQANEKNEFRELEDQLTEEYQASMKDFSFQRVQYLPEKRYTNLGVFARRDVEKGIEMKLSGLLADIPTSEELPADADVSVFQRKKEQLMLGPLSFVNHSCWPNSVYTINRDVMSLRSLRTIKEGEEITVKYGPEYFGNYNEDCLCPHIEFHGRGVVVLNSRTRSQARVAGEKGSVLECGGLKRKVKRTVGSKRLIREVLQPGLVEHR